MAEDRARAEIQDLIRAEVPLDQDLEAILGMLPSPPAFWQLPERACAAASLKEGLTNGRGDPLPLQAAFACLELAIRLLDQSSTADQPDRSCHLALALLQGGAALVMQGFSHPALAQAALRSYLSATIALAQGQLCPPGTPWAVWARKKTGACFGAALQCGALLAGKSAAQAEKFFGLGEQIGLLVQLLADLQAAFAWPADPAWQDGQNFLIQVALTHPSLGLQLRDWQVNLATGPLAVLEQAQRVLIQSGALAQAILTWASGWLQARQDLASLTLIRPQPLYNILLLLRDTFLHSLRHLDADLEHALSLRML
jgi:hypothetical protein